LPGARPSGEVVWPFSYAARLLSRGTASGAPTWHPPTQSSPSYTRAACARPSRTRRSLAARLCSGSVRESSSWKPMHQQPPKMPLLRSTSAANAAHVDASRAFTVYAGSAMTSSLMRATRRASSSRNRGGFGRSADVRLFDVLAVGLARGCERTLLYSCAVVQNPHTLASTSAPERVL